MLSKPNLACVAPTSAPLQPSSTGSRRRRLWDLEHQCHCTVVGVCFPLDALRHLVNKAAGEKTLFDDYQVHVGAVAQCARRNVLSELMQVDLERRYALQIKAYRAAKTAKEVADLWAAAMRHGDVAGAYWAALTHPRCDGALQDALCRDMHMLQHQAGASVRVDMARFHALMDENAVLTRELSKVQDRCTRMLAEKCGEVKALTAQVLQLQAEIAAKDSRLAQLAECGGRMQDVQATPRLLRKFELLTARHSQLEAHNVELQSKLRSAARLLEALCTESMNTQGTHTADTARPYRSAAPLRLNQKTVLCVGGRSGSIANYRQAIERVGGRFTHHDGGLEQSQNVLDASLEAADLVICQTGCISHNAYWKVKDFCKRTGKQCVFVESPSASSLVRGLEHLSRLDTADISAQSASVSQNTTGNAQCVGGSS
ncbi:DUF2325 domain-containing protein [Rhodoferax sp. GW822-FHT02A01]|uniref:DUF2325 domain-containing protein n=1 Tax=Rhodoferax sp. GW822-FHT02A01 TaxID=3141537 RepID=UPI00315CFC80